MAQYPSLSPQVEKQSLFNWQVPSMGWDAVNGIWRPVAVGPDGTLNSAGSGIASAMSSALEASHVIKASPGTLYRLTVTNTKASAQYIMLIDAASVPSNGAVTLLCPPIAVTAASTTVFTPPAPLVGATGLVVANSSTGTFSLTIGSADCIFQWQSI